MSTNKELSQRFIKAILENENIKQSQLAKIIKTNSHFEMATIASNTFSSVYDMNYNILIDTAVKSFASGFIFIFAYEGEIRICEVENNVSF